jgi:hypothetical protein
VWNEGEDTFVPISFVPRLITLSLLQVFFFLSSLLPETCKTEKMIIVSFVQEGNAHFLPPFLQESKTTEARKDVK